MADPVLELDAAASNIDGTNPGTAMLLVDATTGWGLTAFDAPQPELKLLWTSSIDTDGARRADPGNYENRTITATLSCERSTAALLQAQLRILGTKVGKINREGGPTGVGGTLKVTYPSGNTFIFDLLTASHNFTFDDAFVLGNLAQVTVTFTGLPGARGAEQDLGDNVETTLPALIFTEASIPGDMPALGRLVVDDDSGFDQWWVTWGIQSRYYSSAATAALFYEAEGRTPLGSAATATNSSGASGGTPNVVRHSDLATSFLAILSTQASGGGAHLSHVGTFRVYARVWVPATNLGTVTVALEWGEGDRLRSAVNAATDLSPAGRLRIVDLGIVTLRAVAAGTQQWEGRIIAKSTVLGDDIDIDYLLFVPVDEGSAVVRAVQRFDTPTSFLARDEFDQTAGALTGKTLPAGGTWTVVASSDADDFSVETTGKTAQRTAVSDSAGLGRMVTAGTTNYTAVAVQADVKRSAAVGARKFVAARITDLDNALVGGYDGSRGAWVVSRLGTGTSESILASYDEDLQVGVFWTVRLMVTAGGHFALWRLRQDAVAGQPLLVGSDPALATGGSGQTGKIGIYDEYGGSVACTRNYDNFLAFTPVSDAAIFASQSLEIRHDRASRENSSGTLWSRVASNEGDYLLLPPAGLESRQTRVVIKGSRTDPTKQDPAIDDISARLFVTPRYLNVPSA